MAEPREHNILILHSYHQGLEWTDNISAGILDVFKDRTDVNLIFEYLDTKRNYNEAYRKELYELYKVKSNQIPFDLILVSDNAAFNFIKRYRGEFYPDIPVLYCGVNNLDTVFVKNTPLLLGTGEKADHYGTLSSIETVFPERKNVLIINDNTLTGKNIRIELNNVLKQFKGRLNFEYASNFTIKSLQEKVKQLDDSYVIYLLVINRDRNGNFISYKKGISKIKEASKVPIFGSWDFYEDRGIIGGKIIRGWEQGKYIAEIAEKIIDGALVHEFPKYVFLENKYVFDYHQMAQFGISENELPKNSILINKPHWKDTLVQVALIIIFVLFLCLLFVIVRLRVKRIRMLNMEEVIKKRTLELNKVNKDLSENIVAKDKFFSILAHDLKNPFNSMLGLSERLNENFDNYNFDKQKMFIGVIHDELKKTYSLLEDLLLWGRTQKGNMPFRPETLNLHSISNEIIELSGQQAANKSIKISNRIKVDTPIEADRFMMATIIRNLISNAIKFTHRGGNMVIDAQANNPFVEISVKDNGIGIEKENQSKIFTLGKSKSTNGTENESGTGLGLVLCKEFVEKHGGKIWVESEVDKGSVFCFTLQQTQKL